MYYVTITNVCILYIKLYYYNNKYKKIKNIEHVILYDVVATVKGTDYSTPGNGKYNSCYYIYIYMYAYFVTFTKELNATSSVYPTLPILRLH